VRRKEARGEERREEGEKGGRRTVGALTKFSSWRDEICGLRREEAKKEAEEERQMRRSKGGERRQKGGKREGGRKE
jgi:hypothetical protein